MTKHERAQLDMFPDSPESTRIRAAEALEEALELRYRIEAILKIAAVSTRPCEACGTTIFFVQNVTRKTLIPFQADGQSHFKTCPNAADFTRRKERT